MDTPGLTPPGLPSPALLPRSCLNLLWSAVEERHTVFQAWLYRPVRSYRGQL